MRLVGDCRIEGGQVDHTHRLGAQHERIIADAFLVDLRGEGGRADLCEALFRIDRDAVREQVRGHEVDRVTNPRRMVSIPPVLLSALRGDQKSS